MQAYFTELRAEIQKQIQQAMDDRGGVSPRLRNAMRYVVTNGGKRLRAMLTLATLDSLNQPRTLGYSSAVAIELIHAYSLVHDDLPAMDDDDMRRGQPTCHVAYDEATAILCGDALQALAFELLAEDSSLATDVRVRMIATLARASGDLGMVGGQMIDLEAVGRQQPLHQLQQMHLCKTGALFQTSVVLPALASGQSQTVIATLTEFARMVGIAFQIQDDIIDVTSSTETLGKTQGKDAVQNKSTYTTLLGIEGARKKAEELLQQSLDLLEATNLNAAPLSYLARAMVNRDH